MPMAHDDICLVPRTSYLASYLPPLTSKPPTLYNRPTMTHPLVEQLRFARSEFRRGLEGVTEDEAQRRFLPMNCIAWNVGHLTWQEQRYWLQRAQDQLPRPDINERFAYGAPASTPSLDEVWAAWREITEAAHPWLDAVTTEKLEWNLMIGGEG